MTWKLELGLLAGTLSLYAVPISGLAETLSETDDTRIEHFSERDHAAFDRGFELGGELCGVGIKHLRICYEDDPREAAIKVGHRWPEHFAPAPAGLPVLVHTDTKLETLDTYHVGTSLFLVDAQNNNVVGKLDMQEPQFQSAVVTSEPINSFAVLDGNGDATPTLR